MEFVRKESQEVNFILGLRSLGQVLSLFFCLHPLFLEGCGDNSCRLSRHTSRSSNTDCTWIKSQTVPTNILNIIKPSCLWSSNWPLPIKFTLYSLLRKLFLRHTTYMAKPTIFLFGEVAT